ncbi:hypothetical protein DFR52_104303 [Hoeflea marina]|uniref:Sulfotransferase domain-containing protein n=1 Tax=Hoeflea marina TaxID=274592 RepID=A0A317PHF1_9HYPH|nr:hypothetical protein [Hoeflea marina]PWV99012.1 hypothetical protein DFR52_104303 [Hoeflea marina]
MTLLIHIGTTKTGSKGIQTFLQRNQQILLRYGCVWPTEGRDGNWHRPLVFDFDPAMIPVLAGQVAEASHAVISFENLYEAGDSLIEHLSRLSDAPTVLLFVRNPVDWVNSFLNQMVKSHRRSIRDIDGFAWNDAGLSNRFDVESHLRRWERVFGRQAIRVVPYSRQRSSVMPVIECLDLPEAALAELTFPAENMNKAADISSLRVLYRLKQQIGVDDMERLVRGVTLAHRHLAERWIDSRVAAVPMLLGRADRDAIAAALGGPTRAIAERYGLGESLMTDGDWSEAEGARFSRPTDEEAELADALYRASA